MTDRRLGRGLESLITRTDAAPDQHVHEISLEAIVPNPSQPRQAISEASIEGLAQSIKAYGVLQPIVVRRMEGGFELVAGERRLRAARIAGKPTIPALIIEVGESESLELALIENIQRENLSHLEEAEAFREILTASKMTQQQLADRLGRSRAGLANALRLLELPEEVKALLRSGSLSAGQAKVLLTVQSRPIMAILASQAAKHGWSVRELERRVSLSSRSESPPKKKQAKARMPTLASYEEQLRIIYGTKVRLEGTQDRGRVSLEYYSHADMNRLLELLLAAGIALDEQSKSRTGVGSDQLPATEPAA